MSDDRRHPAAPSRPEPPRSPPSGLAASAVAAGGLGLAWFLSNLPGPWAPPIVGWLNLALCALLGGAATWRAATAPGVIEAGRRFWRRVALAEFLAVVAVLSNARDALTGPVVPSPTMSGFTLAAFTAVVLLPLWAVMRLPGAVATPCPGRLRCWLDLGIVVITTGLLTWYLLLRGAGPVALPHSPVAALLIAVLASVVVLALSKAALVAEAVIDRRALRLLAASATVGVLTALLSPLLAGRPQLSDAMLSLPLGLTMATVAAEIHRRAAAGLPAAAGPPTAARPPRRRPFSLVPYTAVAATDGLLVAVSYDGGPRAVVVAAGAATVTGLVVYRQIMAFYDNARLLHQVDAGMRQLRDAQWQIAYQAEHDDLTGLPNRRLFEEQVRAALDHTERACVVLVDLDDFKTINDHLGHLLGDALLVVVGRRLRGCVRPDDTVARFGGDEFALLLRDMSAGHVAEVLARVGTALQQPISVAGHDLLVQSSFGVADLAPGTTPTELLRRADLALYAAKERGKGRHVWYEPTLDRTAANDAQLGADLRQALDRDEFHLLYQPVVRLPDGRPAGAEALVRWRHPRLGMVRPDAFIGVAERTGLIAPLGRWILNEACRQAGEWLRSCGATQPWRVSVNISARQLREPGLADEVAAALRAADLPASRLMVEVTETAVFDNEPAVDALNQISALGVAVALDDFGTGHSSLGLLRTTPVDVLKVDRSFVQGVTGSTEEAVIATAMIQLTEGLHLGAVAEGVETVAQAQRLYQVGYRLAQGYLFAPPLPAAEVGALLAEEAGRSVAAA